MHTFSCIHFDTLIDFIHTRAFDVRVLILAPGSLCSCQDLEIFLEVLRWIYCRSATSDKAPGWSSFAVLFWSFLHFSAILLILPGKSLRLTAFGRVLQNRGRLMAPQEASRGIYWFTCWKEGATPRNRCNAVNVGPRRGWLIMQQEC